MSIALSRFFVKFFLSTAKRIGKQPRRCPMRVLLSAVLKKSCSQAPCRHFVPDGSSLPLWLSRLHPAGGCA